MGSDAGCFKVHLGDRSQNGSPISCALKQMEKCGLLDGDCSLENRFAYSCIMVFSQKGTFLLNVSRGCANSKTFSCMTRKHAGFFGNDAKSDLRFVERHISSQCFQRLC